MKKVLDKTASRCYNKQVAGQPADERRTLKIEQYRILVTEPLKCKEHLKIPNSNSQDASDCVLSERDLTLLK